MQSKLRKITLGLAFTAIAVFAQTKPAFEVASIKPSAPLDMAKMAAAIQNGQMPKIGAHVDADRAEYTYLDLKSLIALAYAVKPYQITAPDWMANARFDIVAKLPDKASKADAPKMLQTLLEDRFKLTFHRTTAEHPVLALVVGKGGSRLKESTEVPVAVDESAPLKDGEMIQQGPDGPVKVTMNVSKPGSGVMDMGTKGRITYGIDPANGTMHMDGSMMTMSAFADILNQFSQMGGGGASGPQIVDMTGLKGNYQAAIDFSLADLIAMMRSRGMDIPGGAPGARTAGEAIDPDGKSSLIQAVQALGLKLESRKAPVEQLIVDHMEKTPTDN
jgi:uncharacterized protein (TIGR03435 family)